MTGISSFRSYVPELESEKNKIQKIFEAKEKMYPDSSKKMHDLLLPGELIIGYAEQVIKYGPHGDAARGMTGELACTNFRVMFVTSVQLAHDVNELQNRLLGKQDICLTNIDSIFVDYLNKRKRLVPGSKIKDGIERLELHCKDFRISAFSFKMAVKYAEKKIIETILQYAYPTVVTRLFAFDYKPSLEVPQESGVPLYQDYQDWQDLLRQHNIEDKWRVSAVNKNFDVVPTMGKYLVVPKSITDVTLKRTAPQFNQNRFPVWCWSAPCGASLVRAADLMPETEMVQLKQNYYKEIESTNSKYSSAITIDATKSCPTYAQIQQSFVKLKNMCLLLSIDEYYNGDSTWLANLHQCKWMQFVSTFLSLATDAVRKLVDNQYNVIIKESSGYDATPVLSSLVQLMADPSSRTIVGFKKLIQREWVVGGFPFLDRLGHLFQPIKAKSNNRLTADSDGSNVSPIFLLFLDCVWQLHCQFPSSFEFSAIFLTALHDSTRLTLFDTFIFNNERSRDRKIIECQSTQGFISIWDWSLQFDENTMKLFNNPLYKFAEKKFLLDLLSQNSPPLNHSISASKGSTDAASSSAREDLVKPDGGTLDVCDEMNESKTFKASRTISDNTQGAENSIGMNKKRGNHLSFRRKKKSIDESPLSVFNNDTKSLNTRRISMSQLLRNDFFNHMPCDVLSVQTSVMNLTFWSSCYLRWMAWSHLSGGAPLSVFQFESITFDEIYYLMKQVRSLRIELREEIEEDLKEVLNDSGMYFHHSFTPKEAEAMSQMPGYFPYSCVTDSSQKTTVGTPFISSSRAATLFGFNRSKLKHVRSTSDISVPTSYDDSFPSGSSSSLSSLGSGWDRKRSSSAQPPKPPSQSSKPQKKTPLMPHRQPTPPTSKEHITYVSSV